MERVSTAITSTAEANCARIVAIATPATPMWNTVTNSRSSTVFVTAEKIRKYSGLLVSPTARRMPAPMLYSSSPLSPAK